MIREFNRYFIHTSILKPFLVNLNISIKIFIFIAMNRGLDMKIFDAMDAVLSLTNPTYDLWFLIAPMASRSQGTCLN